MLWQGMKGVFSNGVFRCFQTAGVSHPATHLGDVLRALGRFYKGSAQT